MANFLKFQHYEILIGLIFSSCGVGVKNLETRVDLGGKNLPKGSDSTSSDEEDETSGISSDDQNTPATPSPTTLASPTSDIQGPSDSTTRIQTFTEKLDAWIKPNFEIPQEEIVEICDTVKPILLGEPTLLQIAGPTIIVGDLHSNIWALDCVIREFLRQSAESPINILFLGDYVDRGDKVPGGPNGVKVTTLIFKLKTLFPDKVFLLRGNHEDVSKNSFYGFWQECRKKYDSTDNLSCLYKNVTWERKVVNLDFLENYLLSGQAENATGGSPGVVVFRTINSVFDCLSLAAIISCESFNIFCVHGGIAPKEKDSQVAMNISQISAIAKPIILQKESDQLICNLLWSDPPDVELGENPFWNFTPNYRGNDVVVYNKNVVTEFLNEHNLTHIIRGHGHPIKGYEILFNDKLITLLSSPDIFDSTSNLGFYAVVDKEDLGLKEIFYRGQSFLP